MMNNKSKNKLIKTGDEFPVVYDIPVPSGRSNGAGMSKYPWYKIRRGGSFFVKAGKSRRESVRKTLLDSGRKYYYRNKIKAKLTSMVEKTGVRIWRVK